MLKIIDTKIPKDIRCSFKVKERHVAACCDDCTKGAGVSMGACELRQRSKSRG